MSHLQNPRLSDANQETRPASRDSIDLSLAGDHSMDIPSPTLNYLRRVRRSSIQTHRQSRECEHDDTGASHGSLESEDRQDGEYKLNNDDQGEAEEEREEETTPKAKRRAGPKERERIQTIPTSRSASGLGDTSEQLGDGEGSEGIDTRSRGRGHPDPQLTIRVEKGKNHDQVKRTGLTRGSKANKETLKRKKAHTDWLDYYVALSRKLLIESESEGNEVQVLETLRREINMGEEYVKSIRHSYPNRKKGSASEYYRIDHEVEPGEYEDIRFNMPPM